MRRGNCRIMHVASSQRVSAVCSSHSRNRVYIRNCKFAFEFGLTGIGFGRF